MKQKTIIRICASIMALSGVVILFSTVFPIAAYEWEAAQKFPILISPLVDEKTASYKIVQKDYTKASNWFEGADNKEFGRKNIKYYSITVPALKIENAVVNLGGDDLAQSLIQFPETAEPGKVGSTVIFGHSILPQFFDPKNYLSIFSTLHKLKNGDDIFVAYDGISYHYKVQTLFEVKPTDLQILEQSSTESHLSLVTCSPPGHPLKPRRLIVRAILIPEQN